MFRRRRRSPFPLAEGRLIGRHRKPLPFSAADALHVLRDEALLVLTTALRIHLHHREGLADADITRLMDAASRTNAIYWSLHK